MKRVLYIQYTNPGGYPPLEHSSRILADAGWQVLFLGTGAQGADALRFPEHSAITVRRMRFCPPGWRQKLHYAGFCLWVTGWALRWRPRWIYASDMLACPPASLLSFLPGVSVLYHEHDSPAEISAKSRPGAFIRFCLWARQVCARRAKLCVVPNRQRAQHFERTLRPVRPVAVVWNCPRRAEVRPPREPAEPGKLKLIYHGSIVPQRLPKAAVEAMALLPDGVSLTAVGYETVGSRGYISELRRLAESYGVGGRFHARPGISRYELMLLCGEFDVGLALLPKRSSDLNFQAMTGASNKPFDYLANGLALLVSDLPEWREMFVEPGYALSCDPGDAASIAASIRRLLDNPEEMRRMGERGRKRIESEWNYESQFRPVFDQMAGLAANSAALPETVRQCAVRERSNA